MDRFWELAITTASPRAQERFIEAFESYTQSVIRQAKDRHYGVIRDIHSYLEIRRETIGAKPSFVVLEMDMELPDEVLTHPVIQQLAALSIDMICLGNVCQFTSMSEITVDPNTLGSTGHLLV